MFQMGNSILSRISSMASKQGVAFLFAAFGMLSSSSSLADGGPLGIDHELAYDNSGIWKRTTQTAFLDSLVVGELACGVWEGGETRLGVTCWQAVDASVLSAVSTTALKYVFTRARPSQGDNPNAWFQGGSYQSFPSGEVAAVSAIVTPFILEYGEQQPAIWALEALPIYDGIARMKVQAHWQTDVLAGFAIGSATGYYAHHRDSPLVLSIMPHGIFVGWKSAW
jgi:hypothetical protein